jgi:peptidoglycan/xylan/chitin deacetylase (PgdA/CDA1 family)
MKNMGKFYVALSHDVDRVHKSFQAVTHFIRYVRRGEADHALYQLRAIAKPERYWCFEKIVEIENRYGVKSTYFFLNESYPFRPWNLKSWRLSLGYYDISRPDVAGIIRKLDSEGFEIGLHGSYRSYRDRALLKKEKSLLEGILGRRINGIRQHYLNLDPDTWRMQRSLGFIYDASFGHRNAVGFKDDILAPFPLDGQANFFIVPMAIMDCCLMRLPDPWKSAYEIIGIAKNCSALLVLNWHQQIFDEREYPGYRQMYVRIIEECLRKNAEFVTIGSYVEEIAQQKHAADVKG